MVESEADAMPQVEEVDAVPQVDIGDEALATLAAACIEHSRPAASRTCP